MHGTVFGHHPKAAVMNVARTYNAMHVVVVVAWHSYAACAPHMYMSVLCVACRYISFIYNIQFDIAAATDTDTLLTR